MSIAWRSLWSTRQNYLKGGWIGMAALLALHYGAVQPSRDFTGVSMQKATAEAAFEQERREHWYVPHTLSLGQPSRSSSGIVGGVPGGGMVGGLISRVPAPALFGAKVVRTCSLDLLVTNPVDTADKIRLLAEQMSGSLVKSETTGAQDTSSASITVRVPASRFEELRAAVRKLALRVAREQVEAEDVTKQYVDQEARLRNLRAQEEQYLTILRRATAVKDILQVSEKLNEVRGQIEQEQAEFYALSRQVETVALTVWLRTEAEVQVFGLHWRPLYELKYAAVRGLEGLVDYATSMLGFLFYLPAILLWLATILLGGAAAWRIMRRAAKILFAYAKPATVAGKAVS